MDKDKDQFKLPNLIERQYDYSVHKLLDQIFNDFDYYNPFEYIKKIEEFVNSNIFLEAAWNISSRMITMTAISNKKAWNNAIAEQQKSKDIYQLLINQMQGKIGDITRQQIDVNAHLISSTPLNIAQWISNYVLEQQQKGRRADSIALDLQKKIPNLSTSRINLIARTEVSKASTALTYAQSQNLGVKAYIWRTSKDQRVRSSHSHMNDVIVFWDNPPSPEQLIGIKSSLGEYHAGNCPNCRCFPSPIVFPEYVRFPHKVYINGSINWMRKNEFMKLVA